MTEHIGKAEQLYAHLAAEFISRESNRQSLVTVTRAALSPTKTICDIFVTVFPEEQEHIAMQFLTRNHHTLHEYIKSQISSRRVPHFTFVLDKGAKNQHAIEALLSKE
jgi:ribosome-binding factor A